MNEQHTDPAPLHTTQVDGLVSVAGVDGAREILDAFWRSTSNLLENLTNQVGDNALELAAATAHAIKGSAANVGAQRLADTASQVEGACKNSEHHRAIELVQCAYRDFEVFRTCITEHIAKA